MLVFDIELIRIESDRDLGRGREGRRIDGNRRLAAAANHPGHDAASSILGARSSESTTRDLLEGPRKWRQDRIANTNENGCARARDLFDAWKWSYSGREV